MEVVKTNQNLSGYSPYQGDWNTLVVVSLHYFKQVYAQNLKDHNEVVSIRSIMHERVEQLNYLGVKTSELAV